jgi:hypothetical protein
MRHRLRFHKRDLPRILELYLTFPGVAVGVTAGDVYAAAPAGVTGGGECAAAEAALDTAASILMTHSS